MMHFVLKIMKFALKMMDFVQQWDILRKTGSVDVPASKEDDHSLPKKSTTGNRCVYMLKMTELTQNVTYER